MSKMKELYEKVAADSALQAKFAEILKNAEAAGEAATKEKLTAFAREAGYDISIEEMQEFFGELAESKERDLSDAELDQVAGGKGEGAGMAATWGVVSALTAIFTLGASLAGCIPGMIQGIAYEDATSRLPR